MLSSRPMYSPLMPVKTKTPKNAIKKMDRNWVLCLNMSLIIFFRASSHHYDSLAFFWILIKMVEDFKNVYISILSNIINADASSYLSDILN